MYGVRCTLYTVHRWRDYVTHGWYFVHLRKALLNGIAEFSFFKKDGSIREARGTLCELIIPREVLENIKKPDAEPNYSVFSFWDIDKQSWRSFRVTDFIGFVDYWRLSAANFIEKKKADKRKEPKEN